MYIRKGKGFYVSSLKWCAMSWLAAKPLRVNNVISTFNSLLIALFFSLLLLV